MEKIWKRMYNYIPGAALIFFGCAILLFPFLLVALIALFFIFAGFIALVWAKRLERIEKDPLNEFTVWYRRSSWPERFQRASIFKN